MATQPNTETTGGVSKLLRLVGIMKGLDEAALRDIEQIDSVSQDHVQPGLMPSKTEVDTARSQAMRGGRASPEVDAHSDLQAQVGLTRMYEEFDRRLAAMEKAHTGTTENVKAIATSVKAIVSTLTTAKAEAEKDEKEAAEKAQKAADAAAALAKSEAEEKEAAEKAAKSFDKAFRKARIAVTKAVSEEEEETDRGESMEKAQAALIAVRAMISKAEDEAESDSDEEKIEKARQDLKTLKAQIAKFEAKKAAPVVAPVVAAVTEKADHTEALADFAKARGITVNDLFASMGQGPTAAIVPPVFAKAVKSAVLTAALLDERIEAAVEAGNLTHPEIMKAQTMKSRLAAVRGGKYDAENFAREMSMASQAVQELFAVPAAA